MTDRISDAASTSLRGLTVEEASRRLVAEGPNELSVGRARSTLETAAGVLAEPMLLLLLAAGGIYLALGELRDALILASSIAVIVAITIYQERRTDRALEALRDLSSPRAIVVRDGIEQRIAGRDVVRGDIVLLREGDRVPADALLREAVEIAVDESLLTGESLPVDKAADRITTTIGPPGSGPSFVYAGTLVVHGHGVAEIVATGASTEMGRIGRALAAIKPEATPLQLDTRRVVRGLAIGGVVLCVVIALAYGILRGDWLDAGLAGVTLAMGILPEEFPIVVTVFLALGAWRISKRGVLTRRMPAVETLGATTILCVDKTGTLTENRMRIVVAETTETRLDLRAQPEVGIDASTRRLFVIAAQASELDAFDPMERAIREGSRALAPDETAELDTMELVREYELSADLLAITHVWKSPRDQALLIAAKGAPETIADLCRLDVERRGRLLERAAELANDGLRVLAIASGDLHGDSFPPSPRDFDLRYRGLIALADPVRASVPSAVAECRRAGIRLVMITGDHPGTALAVGRAIGLEIAGGAMVGAEFSTLDDDTLRRRLRDVNVFARVVPEQKLRLVQMLKGDGEVVAMTGDGVNDAPALKAADIGVAMGRRGTDVAREAAALVLVDDDFASLVAAIRQGRRIYDNIRNAMTYLLAVHIPIAGMGLVPVLAGWPLFLFPVHIVFLEFVIDPACSLVFEAERSKDDVMDRPPRDSRQSLFSRDIVVQSAVLGVAAFAAVVAIYGSALADVGEKQARALAFITLVIGNLLLIVATRSRTGSFLATLVRPNRVFRWLALITLVALAAAAYLPAATMAFRFESPPLAWAATSVGAAALAVAWIDVARFARRRRTAGRKGARLRAR